MFLASRALVVAAALWAEVGYADDISGVPVGCLVGRPRPECDDTPGVPLKVNLYCAHSDYAFLDEAKACLVQLKIKAADVYHTIMHLQHGVTGIYSFEGIAHDSLSSTQKVAEGCNLAVHDVKVDLTQELDILTHDALKDFGVDNLEDLLDLPDKSMLAYDFHERIRDIFDRLNDAHTTYTPPYDNDLPLYEYVNVKDSGELEGVKLRIFRHDAAKEPTVQFLQGGDYRTVQAINGKGAWQWLLEESDKNLGLYKSRGQRMNRYLNAFGGGKFVFKPWPSDGSIEVEFADAYHPSKIEYKVVVYFNGTIGLNKAFQTNPRWEAVQEWLDAHLHLKGAARDKQLAQISASFKPMLANLQDPQPWFGVQQRSDNGDGSDGSEVPRREMERRLEEEDPAAAEIPATEIARFPQISPVFLGYKLKSQNAVVLRVTTFMPVVSDERSILQAFNGLLKVHMEVTKAAEASDRLILDLVDNGGGIVELANVLIAVLAPSRITRRALCNDYATLLNPFWKSWMDSFGGKWEAVKKSVETDDEEVIDDFLSRVASVLELKSLLGVEVPINREVLDKLIADVKNSPDIVTKRKRLIDALDKRHDLFGSDDPDSPNELVGSDVDGGWYPFTGDVKDPTGKAFSPVMEPFEKSEVHDWGSVDRNYSKRYKFACEVPFDSAFLRALENEGLSEGVSFNKSMHQWKEIAVLTNGLCGSACSAVASKLHLALGATVFTYGGVPGEAMDSSAFAGGNVLQWADFWPLTFYAAVIGDIVFGGDTPIGRQLRDPGASKRHYAKTLLLPLPSMAEATFNFNMMFIPELGGEAMPREWYMLPAHRHYDEWHMTDSKDASSWNTLPWLYERIATEDWHALRKQGAFNGAQPQAYGCALGHPGEWPPREEKGLDDVYVCIFISLFLVCCCTVGVYLVRLCYQKRAATFGGEIHNVEEPQAPGGVQMSSFHSQGVGGVTMWPVQTSS